MRGTGRSPSAGGPAAADTSRAQEALRAVETEPGGSALGALLLPPAPTTLVVLADEPLRGRPIPAGVWVASRARILRLIEGPLDAARRALATAAVVADPAGEMASIIARAKEVPDAVREPRMRVHYFEVTRLMKRVDSADRRGKAEVARLLRAQLVTAASKLLFLERREWPAPLDVMLDELGRHAALAPLAERLAQVVSAPAPRDLRKLRGALDEYLVASGVDFVKAPTEIWDYLMFTDAGQAALDTWGGEAVRR